MSAGMQLALKWLKARQARRGAEYSKFKCPIDSWAAQHHTWLLVTTSTVKLAPKGVLRWFLPASVESI